MKTIKEKVRDWGVRYFLETIILHIWLLFLLTSLCYCIFTYYNLFHTDVDSARYMLSALTQSQAAIVAIVVSLTLIAVQLTASSYSPRVIDIFKSPKKNPDFWILLGFYCSSIVYGLFILKLVEGAEGEVVSQSAIWSLGNVSISLEFCVSFAYWLGAFTFVILFPYMWRIMTLLKPEYIIGRLAVEITEKNILNVEEDPIQPIMDIVHGSIRKYDFETTRVGLQAVTEQVIKVIDSDKEKEISKRFCEHLARVSRLAISKEDEDSTVEVIKCLAKFGKSTAEKELKDAISQVTETLGGVGGDAVKKGLEFATSEALNYLGKVGSAAAENKLERETSQAAGIIGFVGKESAEKGFEGATSAARSLRDVGIAAAENKLEDATTQVVVSLEEVGKSAAKKRLEDATWEAVKFLGEVGGAATKQDLKDATSRAVSSLVVVGKSAAEEYLDGAPKLAAMCLGNVGEATAKKSLEGATKWAAICLGELGETTAKKGLEGATLRVAESLGIVGKTAAKQGLKDATSRAVSSLVVIGITSVKNSLEGATEKAARSLADLTISSEEVVKTAIQNYKSKLEEQERDPLQKFMEIYEQELEKLRAKKHSE